MSDECKDCGKPLGPEHHELAGTYLEQRKFFFRDCPDCGAQFVRMVKTWR